MNISHGVTLVVCISIIFGQETYLFAKQTLQIGQTSQVLTKSVSSRAKCAFLCHNYGPSCAFYQFEDGNCTMRTVPEFISLGEILSIDTESSPQGFVSQFQGD